MRWFQSVFCLFRRRPSRPEDIPRLLPPEALARALEEARLLHARHKVDVRQPAPGELPIPRKAEDN